MVMVVQCKCCMTEYRLDEALMKGAKGASIRCPKCRERIIVENPRATRAAPPIGHRVPPPTAPSIGHTVPPPVAPPLPPRVAPPSASQAMPQLTPPVERPIAPPVAPPVPPRVTPPSAPQAMTQLTLPAERPIAPPVAPPVTPRVAPPLASQAMPQLTPPAERPIAPPVAPPAAIETAFSRILLEAPGGMASPVPRDRRAEGADLSEMILYNPPDIPGGKVLRLEDIFIHPAAVERDRIPDGGEYGPVKIRSPRPGWNPPPRRPLYRRPLFLAVAISILLLAGGTIYFVDGNSGRKSSDSVLPVRARSTPENPVFDVGNLKGSLGKQASGERIYVVKGTVTNVGKARSSGIRIEATLVGQDNQAIVKNGTFAGNVIDESLIPHMSRVRIEGFLGMRHGEGDVNRDIPVGKTLPFMVVFFDPPEGVESFRVKAIDWDEAHRIVSPDGIEPGTGLSNQPSIRLNSVAVPN